MTWTDEHGVSHRINFTSALYTECGEEVTSGAPHNPADVPPRIVNCIACITEKTVFDRMRTAMDRMEKNGFVVSPAWLGRHVDPV